MTWYDTLLGIGSTPDSTGANAAVSGATTSNSSGWSSFLSGLANLGTAGANAYATVNKSGSTPAPTSTTTTSTLSSAAWLPLAIIGGIVLVIVALLFRHGD